jgi:putative transposase
MRSLAASLNGKISHKKQESTYIPKAHREPRLMLTAQRIRIYPTQEQKTSIENTFGACRFVYNKRIEEWKKNYELWLADKTHQYKYTTEKELKEQNDFLNYVSSVALQQSRIDAEQAFKNLKSKNAKFPRFKSKHNHRQSYRVGMISQKQYDAGLVVLPLIGTVKKDKQGLKNGKIKSYTVTKEPTGKYYVSALVEIEDKHKKPKCTNGVAIGLDLGIKTLVTESNGVKHNLVVKTDRVKKRQRQLSRKQKGSKNRNKARIRLAMEHAKVANKYKDFLHKLSSKITSENQVVIIEDIKVTQIGNKCRSVYKKNWNMLVGMLAYKANELIKVNPAYTSMMCNACNHIKLDLKLSDRIITCSKCGVVYDRDINAALNILKEGLSSRRADGLSLNDIEVVSKTTSSSQETQGVNLGTVASGRKSHIARN